ARIRPSGFLHAFTGGQAFRATTAQARHPRAAGRHGRLHPVRPAARVRVGEHHTLRRAGGGGVRTRRTGLPRSGGPVLPARLRLARAPPPSSRSQVCRDAGRSQRGRRAGPYAVPGRRDPRCAADEPEAGRLAVGRRAAVTRRRIFSRFGGPFLGGRSFRPTPGSRAGGRGRRWRQRAGGLRKARRVDRKGTPGAREGRARHAEQADSHGVRPLRAHDQDPHPQHHPQASGAQQNRSGRPLPANQNVRRWTRPGVTAMNMTTESPTRFQQVLLLIGKLNYTWTNTESLLIHLIAGLAKVDKETAVIIFLTLNTTRARIDLVERLAKRSRTPKGC